MEESITCKICSNNKSIKKFPENMEKLWNKNQNICCDCLTQKKLERNRENQRKFKASEKGKLSIQKHNHTDSAIARRKRYKKSPKGKLSISKYHSTDSRKEVQSRYLQSENGKEKNKINRKKRSKNDPCFKIRHLVSRNINRALEKNQNSKNGQSCLKYLPYTIQELVCYLESLFEPWMTWNNHGTYSDIWDDNDLSTWTWQIDHIIPHSDLSYISMEDDNFKKCWALNNLRPYSAKQNILDGAKRTRHKK